MCFSNWKIKARQARGLRNLPMEVTEAMQVESPMSENQEQSLTAEGRTTQAEGFNDADQELLFKSMLNHYTPPGMSEAERTRRWAILTLTGNPWDMRFSQPRQATDFWHWCGLQPERWAMVPDQALWKSFLREFELYGGYPNGATQVLPKLAPWVPPPVEVGRRPE